MEVVKTEVLKRAHFKEKLSSLYLIGKTALTHLREKRGASFGACVWATIIATNNKIDEFAWIIVASVNIQIHIYAPFSRADNSCIHKKKLVVDNF